MAEAKEDPQVQQPQQQQEEETAAEAADPAVEDGEGEKNMTGAARPRGHSTPSLSLNIWPPTQRTREAVVHRLVETLTAPSVLSKRYGTVPHDEASAVARQIEQEAFSAASSSVPPPADPDPAATAASDDDGIETLQIYSKEVSRRMLESVKARASSAPFSSPSPAPESPVPSAAASSEAVSGEEISSLESASSQA